MSTKDKQKAKAGFSKRAKKINLKIKKFWIQHEVKAVTAAGLILISVISFEAGALRGQNWQQKPLVIEKVAESSVLKSADSQNKTATSSNSASENQNALLNTNIASASDNTDKKECAFVGSKNSNKYHFPDCSYAKRIKPENIVCFSSEEEAKNKGYVPAGCCVGKNR